MTFTYSGDPSTSARNYVRFLLNDIDSTDVLFSDEEISYVLTEWSNDSYEAARELAEILIARFARLADSTSKSVGDISVSESYSAKSKQYQDLANSFLARKLRKAPPTMWAKADAIKSTDDKTTSDFNTDFVVGSMDNPNSYYETRIVE
jgi:hypothetical protein